MKIFAFTDMPYKNNEELVNIYFRIPMTEYFLGRHLKLSIFRKRFVKGKYRFYKI